MAFGPRITVLCCRFQGLVFMGTHTVSPYQQVVEKTRNGAFTAHKLLDRLKNAKLDGETVCLLFIVIN